MRAVLPLLTTSALIGGALAASAQPGATAPHLAGTTFGSVIQADYGARRLIVAPIRKADGDQSVEVPSDAVLVKIERANAGQIRVGDRISVTGLPLVLDARQVRIGDERPTVPVRRAPAPAPVPPPARRGARANQPPPPAPPPPGSTGQFYGQVVRINPLVLSFQAGGPTFEVRTNRFTRFSRLTRITLNQIKLRDAVMIQGRRQPDGKLIARRIQVGTEGLPFIQPR